MSLVVSHLSKNYAGVQALQDVTFTLAPSSITALIGPNGAGKSTCFAAIAGQIQVDAGAVSWKGCRLLGLSPQKRLAAGVARTFQVAQVFEALSVQQNILLALHAGGAKASNGVNADADTALTLLSQVGLSDVTDQIAATLPYGAKKRLELALALAAKPTLLLLDEPAAGLNETERHSLMALIGSLPKRQHHPVTVLYTEHNMDAVFGQVDQHQPIADRVLVLMEGRLMADGSPAEIAANTEVRLRYLGRNFHAGQNFYA